MKNLQICACKSSIQKTEADCLLQVHGWPELQDEILS